MENPITMDDLGVPLFSGNIQLVVEPSHLKSMTRQIGVIISPGSKGVKNNGNHPENVWSFTTYGFLSKNQLIAPVFPQKNTHMWLK